MCPSLAINLVLEHLTFKIDFFKFQANELLLGGRKVTAIEACQLGLVSQVLWPTSMMQEVIPKIQNIALNSAKVTSVKEYSFCCTGLVNLFLRNSTSN